MKKKIKRIFTVKDLETLKVISDPLRIKIFDFVSMANQDGELRTVKQISKHLGMPPHKLYYHINLLEKHGLIEVAHTQVVSGIIEKHYQVKALSITIDPGLFSSDLPVGEKTKAALSVLDGVFETTRSEFINSLEDAFNRQKTMPRVGKRTGHLSRGLARLSQDQANAFYQKLGDLVKEFEHLEPDESGDTHVFSLTVVMLPTRREAVDEGQPEAGDPTPHKETDDNQRTATPP